MKPCPACGARSAETAYRLDGYDLLRCGACGLLFNGAFPPDESKAAAFSEHYYHGVQSEAFRRTGKDYLSDPSVPVFRRWLERLGPPGALLDVGCGLGTFLAVARDAGWTVSGLDVSPFAAKTVKETLGIDVVAGSLADVPLPDASFDAVTMWDSIEHVDEPRRYLERARALLKPGGVLLVATDNFDCLGCDVARFAYAATGGAVRYGMRKFYIPYNATYFTEARFRALLAECGFEVETFEKMEYPLSKLNVSPLERALVAALYAAAGATGRQAQFTLIARAAGAREPGRTPGTVRRA